MARKKKNSSRVNLVISVVVHGVVVLLLGFWAAHEGVLGTKLKEITVAIVPKEKPPEPEKPPPPKVEPPKEEPKVVEPPKIVENTPPPPQQPPPQSAPPANTGTAPVSAAPAPAELPDFNFSDGAKIVETSTNAPVIYYKSLVEYALRSNWERPTDLPDTGYVAEVEVSVDAAGRITGSNWKKGSGDKKWDDSVKRALAATKSLNRPPPKDFPGKVLVRFDVLPATELIVQ
ncbi:TonB C-terminal domain-containing protein [Pedosphaera parvula]|uniref:TonB-dependent receptor, putative n=1 Tax=Pedosphaera parvula (strain Ellin514) TaxID=320771 RepID=B9XNX3_PEDPL|nr:TonB C-terminal domain-containing protein [Pedosphaera parvula]EEF58439.1 TonB-dependent receptor, putative [Pedosphaera parvula Ellin514]